MLKSTYCKNINSVIIWIQILILSISFFNPSDKPAILIFFLPFFALFMMNMLVLQNKSSKKIIFLFALSSLWMLPHSFCRFNNIQISTTLSYSILVIIFIFLLSQKEKQFFLPHIAIVALLSCFFIFADLLEAFVILFLATIFVHNMKKNIEISKLMSETILKSQFFSAYILLTITAIASLIIFGVTSFFGISILVFILIEIEEIIKFNSQMDYYNSPELIQEIALEKIKISSNQNMILSEYLHDDVLQNILYIRRKIYDVKNISDNTAPAEIEDCIHALDDTVNSIRNEMDYISPNISTNISLKKNFLQAINKVKKLYDKNILLEFYCDENLFLTRPFDEITYRIIKELSNNIYKHTDSTFAEIRVELIDDILFINSRNDSGNIVDLENCLKSNRGLGFIKKTISDINGDMVINNLEPNGVSIDIKFKIKRSDFFENIID